jgi:hypothetical protein
MPYKIIKARGKKAGYYVKNLETGHKYSNAPLPYDRALKQLAVLQLRKRGVPPLPKGRKSPPKRSARRTRRSAPKRSPRRR